MDYSKLNEARELYISVLKSRELDTPQNIFKWNSFDLEETQYWIDRLETQENT